LKKRKKLTPEAHFANLANKLELQSGLTNTSDMRLIQR